MGGSFNPIHLGHTKMAAAAQKCADLERVVFMPSGNPPHKNMTEVTNEQRYQMLLLAIAKEKTFAPSRLELDREGVIYSVDTLKLLKKENPKSAVYFIIGEDTLHDLNKWRDYETVFTLCTFLVVRRETDTNDSYSEGLRKMRALGARIEEVAMPLFDASSTEIRMQLAQGIMPDTISPAVGAYIGLCGLYGYAAYIEGAAPMVDRLSATQSPSLFAHSLGVCAYARHLAEIHGADMREATLAGLLHDCAKGLPLKRQQRLSGAQDADILSSSSLLHSSAGERLAKDEYGIVDEAVLHAIGCHTVGAQAMNKLDMITYLADKIELGRKPYEGLDALRRLADEDLRAAVIQAMESTLVYLRARKEKIHHSLSDSLKSLKRRKPNG